MPGGAASVNRRRFRSTGGKRALSNSALISCSWGTDGIDLNVGVTTFNEFYTVSNAMCNAAREGDSDGGLLQNLVIQAQCGVQSGNRRQTDHGREDRSAFRPGAGSKVEVIITGESNE